MRGGWNGRTAVATAVAFGLLVAGGAVAFEHQTVVASPDAAFVKAEAWAFPKSHSPDPSVPPHASASTLDPHKVLHVSGSTRSYTQAQLDNEHFVPDWFPQDHPPMPQIVARHRRPGWPWPCAECHLPNGSGEPPTASLAGLPEAYILEQIAAFRNGERGMSVPKTTQAMAREARSLDAADLQFAAGYFSRLTFTSSVRVIETVTVPKTHWIYFVPKPDKNGAREPIGERIIETPVNFHDYALSDGRDGYVAYVPPGSITAGAKIAAHGVGAAPACESCHGAKLQGVGVIPYLAGRSPTYIARELILFRLGRRTNPGAAPMRAEVSRLTLQDMIDVAAYAASRKP